MATTQPSTASVVSQFGNRSAMMNNTAHMQHPTRAAVVGVVATQFGTRNNSSNCDRSSLPDCVHNTLPLSMLIPLDAPSYVVRNFFVNPHSWNSVSDANGFAIN